MNKLARYNVLGLNNRIYKRAFELLDKNAYYGPLDPVNAFEEATGIEPAIYSGYVAPTKPAKVPMDWRKLYRESFSTKGVGEMWRKGSTLGKSIPQRLLYIAAKRPGLAGLVGAGLAGGTGLGLGLLNRRNRD